MTANSPHTHFWLATGLLLLTLSQAAPSGADWRTLISPDTTIQLQSLVHDQELVEPNGDLSAIPQPSANVDLVAFHHFPRLNNDYFVYDTAVDLPGGIHARQGAVVRHTGSAFIPVFSTQTLGLPLGVEFDAFTTDATHALVSFNITVQLGAFTVQDEDVFRIAGGSSELIFDGSAEGIAPGLDLDAVHLDTDEQLLFVSFDGHGQVAGLDFSDQDVLIFDLTNDTWAPWFFGEAADAGWNGAAIDALTLIPLVDEGALFADGFETGDTSAWQ